MPSYVKDTIDFINKINNQNIPKESIFVALDVKSLYTSIPNPEGIAAVKKSPRTLPTQNSSNKGYSYFFSTYFDLQQLHIPFKVLLTKKGCAMGTICAPTLCKYLYGLLRRETHLPIN